MIKNQLDKLPVKTRFVLFVLGFFVCIIGLVFAMVSSEPIISTAAALYFMSRWLWSDYNHETLKRQKTATRRMVYGMPTSPEHEQNVSVDIGLGEYKPKDEDHDEKLGRIRRIFQN